MKTMKIFSALFFVLLTLFSCQKEGMTVQEEGAITGLAAKNMKVARTAAECAASSVCIDPVNPVYHPEGGTVTGAIGSNSKQIVYSVYNTLTNFVVTLAYTRTPSNNATSTVNVTVGGESQQVVLTNGAASTTLYFSLPMGWQSCTPLSWSFVETDFDGALAMAASGTYYLYGACVACTESFTYVDNGNKTYTYTYTPEEDMDDAALVFTFAQGVAVSGLDSWTTSGSTRQTTMDLEACQTYTWTVGLTADCSGNSGNSNVWTDFKVNSVSKKANVEDKFTQTCP